MRVGPSPIPSELKKLRGNPGQRKIRPNPQFRKGEYPAPPKMLTPLAKEEWLRISEEVYRLGLLTTADLNVFAAYCMAYEAWIEADLKARDDQGKLLFTLTSEKTGNEYINPAYNVLVAATANMVKYACEFGLSPSSRSRIAVREDKAEDELDGLLAN